MKRALCTTVYNPTLCLYWQSYRKVDQNNVFSIPNDTLAVKSLAVLLTANKRKKLERSFLKEGLR